ncbi:MAG: VWA domain-containing protein, partial [Phycisphaerales bacterium]|nr:VWA domain-containing protein [Phycisphaerales bacterium]
VCQGVRVGVVGYRDRRSKEFEQIGWNFTPSIAEAREHLWKLSALGGGDRPELVDKGLQLAYEKLAWNRTHRGILVLVGDAPPHPGRGTACIDMASRAFRKGVTTHVIGCDPRIEDTETPEQDTGREDPDGPKLDEGIPGGPKPGRAPNRRRPGEPRKAIEFFPDIAEAGGGRVVNLARDERLVPEIAGLIVGKEFEEPLVEFFSVYLQICR